MSPCFTKWILVLGLGIVPLAAHPCFAPGGPGKGGGLRQDFLMSRVSERLNLTENQKTQIKDIQARHADPVKLKEEAVLEARKTFRNACQEAATTPAQIKTLYQAKSDKTFELMLERRTLRSEMRAVLTPDQRIEWDKLQAYHRGLRQGMRGRGGHGGKF